MTIEGFRKRDTSITIDGNAVDLQYPIYDALEAGGVAILRLNYYNMPPDDPLKGRNIVALDRNGKEVWRIEPFWHMVESNDRSRKVPAAYTGIDLGEDGKLYAYQGIGYICEIDLRTGKIIHEEQTR